MTELQLTSELGRAIGASPEAAHDAIRSAIAAYLRDQGAQLAAIKFEQAMDFADPGQLQ